MSQNVSLQEVVHSLEQGKLSRIITVCIIVLGAVIASFAFLFVNFKGLGTQAGMEQAVVAREIARGNGFSTKALRPAALWQIENHQGELPQDRIPETYHAPGAPFVNAIALAVFKNTWAAAPQKKGNFVFAQDRVIAAVAVICFLLAVLISFFTLKTLFDLRIAALSTAMVLLIDTFWEYALSGLPQMLMLLLVTAAIHFLVLAMQSQERGGRIDVPLALSGLMLGLLFLTHHGMILVFVGAMVFASIWFRPRGLSALWMAGFFLLCAVPWIVRNMMVTGNPTGIAYMAMLEGIGSSEAMHMRTYGPPDLVNFGLGTIRARLRTGFSAQIGDIVQLLGVSIAAPVFFVSLIHSFRKTITAAARWLVLALWLGATLAAVLLGGASAAELDANQFQLLFIPAMTAYGVAFLLVLWNRLSVGLPVLRWAFIALLFLLPVFNFLASVLPSRSGKIHWPPYFPAAISQVGGKDGWMKPEELTSSDMPWAVAWYADRDCLWLPKRLTDFYEFNDFLRLDRPVKALFLSPISSDVSLSGAIYRGDYSEWIPLAMRAALPQGFPLTAVLPIPVVDRKFADLMFLADYPRWDPKAAEQFLREQEEEKGEKKDDNKDAVNPIPSGS